MLTLVAICLLVVAIGNFLAIRHISQQVRELSDHHHGGYTLGSHVIFREKK